MNIDKIFEYKEKLQNDLTFEEISKLYRECMYDEYTKLEYDDAIHMYQILRGCIDIFNQMLKGRKFDKDYLKDTVVWR